MPPLMYVMPWGPKTITSKLASLHEAGSNGHHAQQTYAVLKKTATFSPMDKVGSYNPM